MNNKKIEIFKDDISFKTKDKYYIIDYILGKINFDV